MDDKRLQKESSEKIGSEDAERAPIPLPQKQQQETLLQQITGNRDKITYVFQQEGNVGCIHYDALRGEIYLNGHNIRTMKLTEEQWMILEEFYLKLRHHPTLRSSSYSRTLSQISKESGRLRIPLSIMQEG